MEIFVLRPSAPWGGHGKIFAHGMSAHLARVDGRIQLERAGPFVPPITLPGIGDIVVTSAARKNLENGFAGLSFAAVDKVHIVQLDDWDAWDRESELPPLMPDRGEPENYILSRPHSDPTSRQIGDLWEMKLIEYGFGTSELVTKRPRVHRIKIAIDARPPAFFRTSGHRGVFVTDAGHDWLKKHGGDFFRLELVETTS